MSFIHRRLAVSVLPSLRRASCRGQAARAVLVATAGSSGSFSSLFWSPRTVSSGARLPISTVAPRTSAVGGLWRAYSTEKATEELPPVKIWSFEEIQQLTETPNSDIVLVDTREPTELEETGRIPGAINIPITSQPDGFLIDDGDFEDRFGFVRPSQDTEVVFYCLAGVRSRAAAQLARNAGWKHAGDYSGSWREWTAKGGAVQR